MREDDRIAERVRIEPRADLIRHCTQWLLYSFAGNTVLWEEEGGDGAGGGKRTIMCAPCL